MALPPRGAGLVPLVPWVFLAARSVRREPALWDGLAPPELWFCWHTEGNCLPWSCVAPLFCPRPLQLPACSAAGDCGHCAGREGAALPDPRHADSRALKEPDVSTQIETVRKLAVSPRNHSLGFCHRCLLLVCCCCFFF